jgi:hypothetical protein
MNEYLKGNYKIEAEITEDAEAADSTDEFEKKALARLGGSICFVSKKKLMWNGDEADGAGSKDR